MTWPWASRTRISLNVNPDGCIETSRNSTNQLVDLWSRIFSSAREHVNISGEASSSSILKIWIGIWI
jgi:hypothetical protein